jgi:hypothetical protein
MSTSCGGDAPWPSQPWLWTWGSLATKLAGRKQLVRQPSSFDALPSSHSSPAWTVPSPQ